jgi:hypothetical protein
VAESIIVIIVVTLAGTEREKAVNGRNGENANGDGRQCGLPPNFITGQDPEAAPLGA